MTDLLCYGEALWDDYGTEKKIGGAPFNVCAIAKLIGLDSFLVTAVGKDENGHEIKREMDRLSISAICQESDKPTGVAHVRLNKNAQPDFEIEQDCAYEYIEFNSEVEQAAKQAKVICFGSFAQNNEVSRATLLKMLAASRGIKVYDPNLRKGISNQEGILLTSLREADILKMNESEMEEIDKILKNKNRGKMFLSFLMKEFSIKKIFITKGAEGAYLYTDDKKEYYFEPPEIEPVDTTGCGDAFTAGIVYGFVKGLSDEETLKYAVTLSSKAAMYRGAVSKELIS